MIEMEMEKAPPQLGPVVESLREEPKRAPRRLMVALPPAQADQLRKVAEQTGISQADLLAGIERDPAFGAMVTASLRARFKAWRESLAASQIFPEER